MHFAAIKDAWIWCWEIDYMNLNEIKPKRELDNFYFLSLKKCIFTRANY